MIGPVVQDNLIAILIRMRQHKHAVTADVEKMYRMVNVHNDQRSLQQILWRFEPNQELKQYKLNTVTYGTASAPYLATRCLTQLPARVIQHDFYVDDLITGGSNIKQLVATCKGVMEQLESAQFHLRKWNSNNSQLVNEIVGENSCNDSLLNLSSNEYSKTLGLLWSCKEDALLFSVNLNKTLITTKRTILSTMSQIFDPLGLINPCILTAKTLLQKLWSSKIHWDEKVPSDIQCLLHINNIRIPRYILSDNSFSIELHAFSDASLQAYSACVYIKSTSCKKVTVHLVTAKSRVAMTMPRLELSGALLSARARLTEKVKTSFRLPTGVTRQLFWDGLSHQKLNYLNLLYSIESMKL